MKLEQFIEEEIKYASAQENAVPRMKRKTVVEYLTGRLVGLKHKENILREAEKIVSSKTKVKKDVDLPVADKHY